MGRHGVSAMEREAPQPFTVDVEADADLAEACVGDSLDSTVDYSRVCGAVRRVVCGESHALVERLALRIMQETFLGDARIAGLKVSVYKDGADVGVAHGGAGVILSRVRREVLETAVLALGSNLGDRVVRIREAASLLGGVPGIRVASVSGIYETEPVGRADQGPFMNGAVTVETYLDPHALLSAAKGIERSMGRVDTGVWGPRPIDVDIIAYGRLRMEADGLRLPHREYGRRAFVLMPIADMPEAMAVLGLDRGTVIAMAEAAPDYGGLRRTGMAI